MQIMKQFKIIFELIEKRLDIRKVYKNGMGAPFFLLRYFFPILSLISTIIFISLLNLNSEDIEKLIKQLNSLIGIILGFNIASFAIFISINNDKLEKLSRDSEYTYREIGSSLFFYNIEISMIISLIGIILTFLNIPNINLNDIFLNIENMKEINLLNIPNLKRTLFVLYIFMFYQLIFNLFYSSIFLNSSIKK